MCFNGAQSWTLGWYEDTNLLIDVESMHTTNYCEGSPRVYGVASGSPYTIIQLANTNDEFNYFFTYNKNEGITLNTEPEGHSLILTRRSANSFYSDSMVVQIFHSSSIYINYRMDLRKDRRLIKFKISGIKSVGSSLDYANFRECKVENSENENSNPVTCKT